MNIGWILTEASRAELLARFPPRYSNIVAHHVTLPGQPRDAPLPDAARFTIVGRADDGAGVEAMVVAKDGDTKRIDGSSWHITWSLADGRRAVESNDVIAALGWQPLDGGAVETEPGRWESGTGEPGRG